MTEEKARNAIDNYPHDPVAAAIWLLGLIIEEKILPVLKDIRDSLDANS